jgi:predicted RNA-binding Zn ribbon-like protein
MPAPDRDPPWPSYRVRAPNLVGGALCLDFVNTIEWRGAARRGERLVDYGELVVWAEAAGIVDRHTRRRLEAAAKDRPAVAARVLAEAIEFRETLAALLEPYRADAAPLDRLNEWLDRAPKRSRLTAEGEGFRWAGVDAKDTLETPLWPIVWSAADLLASGVAARVRSCADRGCGWMFLDASRGRRRRWCSMEACGNRAKARRHYRRHRAARPRKTRGARRALVGTPP